MIARFLRATIVLMGPQPSLAPLILTPVSLLDLRSRVQLDLADFLRLYRNCLNDYFAGPFILPVLLKLSNIYVYYFFISKCYLISDCLI